MTAPGFRTPQSPHATRPGEPPQLWPLNDPDYYRREQRPLHGAGIGLGVTISAVLLTFLIMAARWLG